MSRIRFHGAMKPSRLPTVILTRSPWWLRALNFLRSL